MASALSGVSRFAFGYVTDRFVDLVKVSIVPAVISAVLSAAFMYSYMNSLSETLANKGDAEALAGIGGSVWSDLAFIVTSTYVSMWLIAKVVRLILTDEAPSVIGSGGTLRSAFWLVLYYIGAVLLVIIPLALVAGVVLGVLFAVNQNPGPGAIVAAILVAVGMIVLMAWALCRFFVGFQPVALGQRPGFFSGWRLTRGVSWVLFFRVIAATLVFYAVLLIFWSAVGVSAMAPMLSPDAAVGTSGEVLDPEVMRNLGRNVAIGQVVMMIFAMPFLWYILALFVETFRRLSTA